MASAKFQSELMNLQSNLLNFAYMLTSNRDDAYDLLQDTTLKALDNEEKYAENTNFKGWVFTIMRNIFINNYRRAGRAATVVDTTDNLYHLNLSQDSGLESPEGSFSAGEITAGTFQRLSLIMRTLKFIVLRACGADDRLCRNFVLRHSLLFCPYILYNKNLSTCIKINLF